MYSMKTGNPEHVCVRETVGKFTISIAFERPCFGGDIRVYRGEADVTCLFSSEPIDATIENLARIASAILNPVLD